MLRFLIIGWGVDWPALIFFAQLLHGLTFGAYHAAAIAAINRWFPGRCQAAGRLCIRVSRLVPEGLVGSLLSGWSWDAGAPRRPSPSARLLRWSACFGCRWVDRKDLDGSGVADQAAPIARD
jgi:hypothetical protein